MQTIIGQDLAEATELLRSDEVVAIPTETVYGLAGNALSEAAVLRIFKAKNRPHFNPLIVHVADAATLAKHVIYVPDAARRLMDAFSPGPITFLLPRKPAIPDLVTSGHPKVALRIPAHPMTLELLHMLDFPLAAPSANPFGYVSPTEAQHVYAGLQGVIPYILDGGPCRVGVESTIVDFEQGDVVIRRSGGISREAIERVTGQKAYLRSHPAEHPVAPGQLKSHYATNTPLLLLDRESIIRRGGGTGIALIEFGEPIPGEYFPRFNLSPKGSADEAAASLFRLMREADASGASLILAEKLPDSGLGAAVNDRLSRAQHHLK